MKLKNIAFISLASASTLLLSACGSTPEKSDTDVVPKNIIMVVADGMGPAYTTAYRLYKDLPETPMIEPTVLDEFLVGTARTYPAPVSGYVTDSAASATALAAGVKTYNGAIGLDVNKQPVESVLHRAKRLGKKTGVAVTSQIVHATPASYIAHNESRRNYDAIADSFLDDRLGDAMVADVMLGGGWRYFIREDRNLVDEFKAQGYQYADSYTDLLSLPKGKPTLGLFADVGLPKALDDTNEHRLSMMTEAAISQLENAKGFFLLVEASQVDWAGHANDIASAMKEMEDLEQTMLLLKNYVAANPDTLVILTADHSTGGLTIGANGDYRWSPEFIHNMKSSVTAISEAVLEQEDMALYVEQEFGFALTDEEINLVSTLNSKMTLREREGVLKLIIDARTNTGWTTSGHTGVDVEVYAFGPGSENFAGNLNNTDIAEKIFAVLGSVK
ncbi:alkaline phosphatase [Glaciecola sp. MH2013]|uniref:alkaline phosphatase n=1 Tax=Glaciecola sp. MH2013 TaxID=2785524 RepID=UPI00189FB9E8|nr:alkaline phosphatase [Glaciecola sp. MH2013]MBF7074824.1 alkaline phosphatase [Glaciecola sp. MH2013]